MKKLIAIALTLLACRAAYALPLGNPTEASLFLNGVWRDNSSCCDPCNPCFSWLNSWSLRVGYYGDFVFNHHLKADGNHAVQRTRLSTNAGYLALNLCNRLDVFTTLGATQLDAHTPVRTFLPTIGGNSVFDFHYREHFSWSVGARATIWQCDCFGIGLEGQYFQTRPHLDSYIDYTFGRIVYVNENNRHTFKEWQVGLGGSYRFATSCPIVAFIPYTGVKWSRARVTTTDFLYIVDEINAFTLGSWRTRNHWGWALGITMELCDMIGVTAEGRWGNEKALYINGQFRF